jgi:hypothetical protein
MPQLLNKREKIILYALIGILILGSAMNFFIMPFLNKNEAMNREIGLQRIKFVKYSRLLRQKGAISERYNNTFSYSQDPGQNEDTLVATLAELEGLAKASDIRIVEIRPEQGSGVRRANDATIVLRAESDMEGYFNFLHSLENSASLLTVKKIMLAAKPSSAVLEGTFYLSVAAGQK